MLTTAHLRNLPDNVEVAWPRDCPQHAPYTLGCMHPGDGFKLQLRLVSGTGRTHARFNCVAGVDLLEHQVGGQGMQACVEFETTGQTSAEDCFNLAKMAVLGALIRVGQEDARV